MRFSLLMECNGMRWNAYGLPKGIESCSTLEPPKLADMPHAHAPATLGSVPVCAVLLLPYSLHG